MEYIDWWKEMAILNAGTLPEERQMRHIQALKVRVVKEFVQQTPIYATDKAKYVRAYKTGQPCKDCKTHFPHYCLEFDHLPVYEKSGNICQMVQESTCSLDDILLEISKCEIVCKNCHQRRTQERRWRVGKFDSDEERERRRNVLPRLVGSPIVLQTIFGETTKKPKKKPRLIAVPLSERPAAPTRELFNLQ